MNQHPVQQQLYGHIVEIHEEGAKRHGKILCSPHYLNVDLETINDIHLGDTVKVHYRFSILKVERLLISEE